MTQKWPKQPSWGPKNAVFQHLTPYYENSDFSNTRISVALVPGLKRHETGIFPKMAQK